LLRRLTRRAITIASQQGSRAVVHRGVGDIAAIEPRHLRLELEQGLQRALGDFRLVRRVAGQELAALDQVIDAGGDVMPVGAAAEEERHLPRHHVAAGERPQLPFHREFARMIGQAFDLAGQAGGLGHIDEQVLDALRTDRAKHGLPIGFGQG
jgi:hypothetical protein